MIDGLLDGIEDAKDRVVYLQNSYLRKRGWQYTCMTPGSRWMWVKQLPDGPTVLVFMEDAVAIQSFLDNATPPADFAGSSMLPAAAESEDE